MELSLPDNINFVKQYIDCETHGYTDARTSGKCNKCELDNEAIEQDKQYEDNVILVKNNSGIYKRFLNSTFSNYIIEDDRQKIIVNQLKLWDFDKSLLLLGNTGNGKTHLACSLIDQGIRLQRTTYYILYYSLTDLRIRNLNLFNEILDKEILVIDEFGRSSSDFKNDMLFEIVNYRYNNYLPTIIISNLDTEKFKQSIGDALYSRLKENCLRLSFTFDDYRFKQ